MDKLLTTHDVARLIQVDTSSVSKWVDKGILLAFRTPGGHRRIRTSDLRSFLMHHQMPIPAELGPGSLRIIAIDDEAKVLDGLERTFKQYGKQVHLTTTTSGVDGLLMVSEQRPDCVLIDVNMPDLNGLELCRRINGRKTLEGVKVLACTARFSPQLEAEALKAGALALLKKPLEAQSVLEHFKQRLAFAPTS